MKKNLLLIIFVISTIASAQNQLRLKEVRQKEKSPQEVLQAFPDVKTWKTPGVISPQKINEYIAARQKKADQLQLMDSMRFWDWNDVDGGWEEDKWKGVKKVTWTYDGNSNLITSDKDILG